MMKHVSLLLQVNNVIVKKSIHAPREEGGLLSHVDLVQMLDIVDLEQGTTVAGKSLHLAPMSDATCFLHSAVFKIQNTLFRFEFSIYHA